jgi:hypothetical protein
MKKSEIKRLDSIFSSMEFHEVVSTYGLSLEMILAEQYAQMNPEISEKLLLMSDMLHYEILIRMDN